ncbi:MAG: right-handed parallel beta-helix repeat-containing protein, partial [Candidatus Kariarchaeaceae archaeon]
RININSSSRLIVIKNVGLFFEIRDSLFVGNGAESGIYFDNVSNGRIYNNSIFDTKEGIYFNSYDGYVKNNSITQNIIFNSSREGISLDGSNNNEISNNSIFKCYKGIYASHSNNNLIAGNTIFKNIGVGIYLSDYSEYNIVRNNHIHTNYNETIPYYGGPDDRAAGIFIWRYSSNNTISYNNISNNGKFGVYAYLYSTSNIISWNQISHNQDDGVYLGSSSVNNSILNNEIRYNKQVGIQQKVNGINDFINNSLVNNWRGIYILMGSANIIGNTIDNSSEFGIYLYGGSNNIYKNTFYNSSSYAIAIHENSDQNEVKENIFIDNNDNNSSQASDDGENNIFSFNYWNDWVSPDADNDGIVDIPYSINGSSNNQDQTPRTYNFLITTKSTILDTSSTIPSMTSPTSLINPGFSYLGLMLIVLALVIYKRK